MSNKNFQFVSYHRALVQNVIISQKLKIKKKNCKSIENKEINN